MPLLRLGPGTDKLLVAMPSRARAAIEVGFVAATIFASTLSTSIALPIALFVLGVILVRPWSAAHGTVAQRIGSALLLVPALGLPLLMERPVEDASARRIGVQLEATPASASGASGGVAKVVAVVPGSPAAGKLAVGDLVVALGGRPLDAADPSGDVVKRVRSRDLPVDTTVDVVRGGAKTSIALRVPWPDEPRRLRFAAVASFVQAHLFLMLVLRGLSGIALVWLLARANGQGAAQLGLARQGLGREVVWGLPGALFAFVADVASAVPALVASAFAQDALQRDMGRRTEGLGQLLPQGSVLAFAVTAVFAAAFEELVFRGFLVPRLRHVTRSWIVAALVASAVFASGHLYEGVYALFQTFVLGLYFSAMFLARGRIESPIVAHAVFNTVVFAIAKGLSESGVLERMQSVVDHAK